MLVLSRKETDKILFPTLGITVEVLRIQGNVARIGVDAPPEVPILRHEIADLKGVEFPADQNTDAKLRQLIGALRHRLDGAASALNQLHEHLEYDRDGRAQQLVMEVFRELHQLEREAGEAVEACPDQRGRALLVEHNPNERELLAGYLQASGFETATAADGQDALDFLSLHALPDVVVLDMQMPRCNGRCFVKHVRSNADLNGLKVFAVSESDPVSLGVSLGPGGIDRWIHKPVNPEQLVTEIAGALGWPAAAV